MTEPYDNGADICKHCQCSKIIKKTESVVNTLRVFRGHIKYYNNIRFRGHINYFSKILYMTPENTQRN